MDLPVFAFRVLSAVLSLLIFSLSMPWFSVIPSFSSSSAFLYIPSVQIFHIGPAYPYFIFPPVSCCWVWSYSFGSTVPNFSLLTLYTMVVKVVTFFSIPPCIAVWTMLDRSLSRSLHAFSSSIRGQLILSLLASDGVSPASKSPRLQALSLLESGAKKSPVLWFDSWLGSSNDSLELNALLCALRLA